MSSTLHPSIKNLWVCILDEVCLGLREGDSQDASSQVELCFGPGVIYRTGEPSLDHTSSWGCQNQVLAHNFNVDIRSTTDIFAELRDRPHASLAFLLDTRDLQECEREQRSQFEELAQRKNWTPADFALQADLGNAEGEVKKNIQISNSSACARLSERKLCSESAQPAHVGT